MSIAPTGSETQTYNNRGITPECASQRPQGNENTACSLETVVSREVWACSLDAARWERLIALRAAIRCGTYRVPAEELADCLLRRSVTEHGAKSAMYSA